MYVPKAKKLPSGSWFIHLRLGGKSIPVTERTESACVKRAQLLKAEYLAGKREKQAAPASPPTLREAIEADIKSKDKLRSPATIRGYRIIQRNRFKGIMDRPIDELTDEDLKQAVNDEAELCKPKTLTNAWRYIGTVLRNQAKRQPPKVILAQIPPNMRPWLDYEEILVFVDAIKGDKYEIPALLALSSLRRSEICAVDWADIDLKRRRIRVQGAVVPGEDHRFVRKETNKNATSTRYVPILMDQLRDALKAVEDKTGPIFRGNPNTLRTAINRLCRKAGLPEVGIQGLRYSFASLAYHLQIPERDTMEIGGWKDKGVMHKIYTRIAQADVKHYEGAMADFYNKRDKNANENANAQ